MQDKRDEYVDQLLSDLKTLEERVIAIKKSDTMPFSFFSESFDTTQNITRLLHEMQLMQIDEMKHQMERLVMFLSESETQTQSQQTQSQQVLVKNEHERAEVMKQEEEAAPYAVSEASAAVGLHESAGVSETTETGAGETPAFDEQKPAETKKEEAVLHEGNSFAGGIILPEYKNPRNADRMASPVKPNPPTPEKEREEKPVITTLNDAIKAPPAVLDLKRGISLNDRFLFQRELFNNDRHEMNNVMIKLNAIDNYMSAEEYLRKSTSWSFDDPVVKNFLQAIKKGFE
ncbi:MAG: hypothetical protein JJE08_07555 [Proteiniphilum sp.]|nr:hypothetical protein [Proteiniphilum sp.]